MNMNFERLILNSNYGAPKGLSDLILYHACNTNSYVTRGKCSPLEMLNGVRPFYLGGSRGMNLKYPALIKISDNTDWDFNIQYNEENEEWIKSLGLEKLNHNPAYKDDQAVNMWVKDNVSVITRKDVTVYIKAFEKMSLYEYLTEHWKSSPFLTQEFNNYKTMHHMNELFKEVETDAT